MDTSFLRLNREFFQTAFWEEERPFSRAEAWLDCLQRAAYRPYHKMIGSSLVEIPEGAFVAAETWLAEHWGWSRTKLHTFFNLLEKHRMIRRKKAGLHILVFLCNSVPFELEKSGEKAAKRPAKSAKKAAEVPAESREKAAEKPPESGEKAYREEEIERKEKKEGEEKEEEKEILLQDSSPTPSLAEVTETAQKLGIDPAIGEAFHRSREKRPRSPGGFWTNKRGQEITDWPADLQAFAKFWMQNLRSGSSRFPAAAVASARGGDPPHQTLSRFGI